MRNFFMYWSLIMGMVIIFMGVIVMMYPPKMVVDTFKDIPYMTPVAGFVIIMYGGFRFYRAYMMVRSKR